MFKTDTIAVQRLLETLVEARKRYSELCVEHKDVLRKLSAIEEARAKASTAVIRASARLERELDDLNAITRVERHGFSADHETV